MSYEPSPELLLHCLNANQTPRDILKAAVESGALVPAERLQEVTEFDCCIATSHGVNCCLDYNRVYRIIDPTEGEGS